MTAERAPYRLPPGPCELIDRSAPISFRSDGEALEGFSGDTIASALAAYGLWVGVPGRAASSAPSRFGHRDTAWQLDVDGEANVRGAARLLSAGAVVATRGARAAGADRPARTRSFDALEPFERGVAGLARSLADGRAAALTRPLGPAAGRLARRWPRSGQGAAAARPVGESGGATARARHLHVDIAIVGGGAGGLAAAVAAATSGAQVALLEADHHLGGRCRLDARARSTVLSLEGEARRVGVELLTGAPVLAAGADGLLYAGRRQGPVDELVAVHAGHVVAATGLVECPWPFPGAALGGVLDVTAARRLLALWSVRPGERAAVFGATEADAIADELDAAGVELVHRGSGSERLPRRVEGDGRVRTLTLADGRTLEVDVVVVAGPSVPDAGLLRALGLRVASSGSGAASGNGGAGGRDAAERASVVAERETVSVAGALAGEGELDEVIAHARIVGRQAAAAVDRRRAVAPFGGVANRRVTPPLPPLRAVGPPPGPGVGAVCSPVRSAPGLVDLEGCRGSAAGQALLRVAARPGLSIEESWTLGELARGRTGTDALPVALGEGTATATRHFGAPLRLAALAALAAPARRRSPVSDVRAEPSARTELVGEWIVASDHGDALAEWRAARESVVLFDGAHLPLFELAGLHATDLVERLAPGQGSREGAVGSATLVAVEGLTDGVLACRLDAHRWWLRCEPRDRVVLDDALAEVLEIEHREWEVCVEEVGDGWPALVLAGPLVPTVLADLAGSARRLGATPVGAAWLLEVSPHATRPDFAELHVPADHAAARWVGLLAAVQALGGRSVGAAALECRLARPNPGRPDPAQSKAPGVTQVGTAPVPPPPGAETAPVPEGEGCPPGEAAT